jgi:hypothetical protein
MDVRQEKAVCACMSTQEVIKSRRAGPYMAGGHERRENLGIKEAVRSRSPMRASRDSCHGQEGGFVEACELR